MRDVKRELWRELFAFLQYLVLLLAALFGAFMWLTTPGDGSAINIKEAWKNEWPYIQCVVFVFVTLSVLRLAAVYLFRRPTGKSLD